MGWLANDHAIQTKEGEKNIITNNEKLSLTRSDYSYRTTFTTTQCEELM